MKRNIHFHYDQLKIHERIFVDDCLSDIMKLKTKPFIPLIGDDRCEHFADAFAKFIIDSRKD